MLLIDSGLAGGAVAYSARWVGSILSNAELRHDWVRTLLPSLWTWDVFVTLCYFMQGQSWLMLRQAARSKLGLADLLALPRRQLNN